MCVSLCHIPRAVQNALYSFSLSNFDVVGRHDAQSSLARKWHEMDGHEAERSASLTKKTGPKAALQQYFTPHYRSRCFQRRQTKYIKRQQTHRACPSVWLETSAPPHSTHGNVPVPLRVPMDPQNSNMKNLRNYRTKTNQTLNNIRHTWMQCTLMRGKRGIPWHSRRHGHVGKT